MSVDCVDGVDTVSDDFDNWEDRNTKTVLWYSREVRVLNPKDTPAPPFDKLYQPIETLPLSAQLHFLHDVMQIFIDEEICNEEEFKWEFAPTFFLQEQLTLATDERYQLILCKSIFKRIYDRLKKEAEKTLIVDLTGIPLLRQS